jgi:UDP-glucuronate decarboxylase
MKNKIENRITDSLNPIILEDLLAIADANLPWSDLSGKTILVTGGSGFLASYLVQIFLIINRLHCLNIKVECVVRNIESAKVKFHAWSKELNLRLFSHDITKPFPEDFPMGDYIIHCASQASPKYYGVDPVGTLLANSVGTAYLLEHATNNRAEKFLFFSSGEVYGAPLEVDKLISEKDYGYLDPMNIRSCYAESKRVGETMCVAWGQQHGLHTSVVRPFHTYGPGMMVDDGRVFADFVADVVAQRAISVNSDGLAQRPFCYVSDAVIAFLTVLFRGKKNEAYNVANPDAEISIRELAQLVANLFPERNIGVKLRESTYSNSYLKSPILRSCPSIEKIRAIGWAPRINLKDGFRRTIQSYL